ncbi:MAG: hypothetical protein WD579_00965 [Candidatus Paceibacterota bacterium]
MEKEKKGELKGEYARLQTRAFSIMIEVIFIFGIPALLAVWIGGMLSEGNTATYILLVVAFILSWVILSFRIKKVNADLKEMRTKLDENK